MQTSMMQSTPGSSYCCLGWSLNLYPRVKLYQHWKRGMRMMTASWPPVYGVLRQAIPDRLDGPVCVFLHTMFLVFEMPSEFQQLLLTSLLFQPSDDVLFFDHVLTAPLRGFSFTLWNCQAGPRFNDILNTSVPHTLTLSTSLRVVNSGMNNSA